MVVLTSSVNENFVLDGLRAGAVGYVLKQVGNDELVRAIHAAQRGQMAPDPKTTTLVIVHLTYKFFNFTETILHYSGVRFAATN